MLEAHSHVISKQKCITSHFLLVLIFHFDIWTGKKCELDGTSIETGSSFSDPFAIWREMVEAPADTQDEFTRIKKDIFHAFHMIPIPVNHGHCAGFLHSLQDHLMCWDPVIWSVVGKTCQSVFGTTFDEMIICNPHYIMECTPWPPSVLVPAIQHVYNMFGNALDAKTGQPLFPSRHGAKQMLDWGLLIRATFLILMVLVYKSFQDEQRRKHQRFCSDHEQT